MAAAAVDTPILPSPTVGKAPESPSSDRSATSRSSRKAPYNVSQKGTPGEQTMKKNKPGSRTTARQETEANLRATRHAYDEDEAEPSSQRTPVNWSRKQPILEYADHERTATDDTETPAGWLKKPVASAEGPTTAKEKAMHEAATDKDDRIWEVAEDLDEPITRQDDWEAKQMSSESADMSCAIMESSHGLGLMKVLACRTIIHVP